MSLIIAFHILFIAVIISVIVAQRLTIIHMIENGKDREEVTTLSLNERAGEIQYILEGAEVGLFRWEIDEDSNVYYDEWSARIFEIGTAAGWYPYNSWAERIQSEEELAIAQRQVVSAVSTGEIYLQILDYVMPDGRPKRVMSVGFPIFKDGSCIGCKGFNVDVTGVSNINESVKKLLDVTVPTSSINKHIARTQLNLLGRLQTLKNLSD